MGRVQAFLQAFAPDFGSEPRNVGARGTRWSDRATPLFRPGHGNPISLRSSRSSGLEAYPRARVACPGVDRVGAEQRRVG